MQLIGIGIKSDLAFLLQQGSRFDRYAKTAASASVSLLRLLIEYTNQENSERVGQVDTSCQTIAEESIDQKLKRIDEKFQGLLAAEQSQPMKSFEERRLQWQREADERLRTEVEEAVARVRRVELSKVRSEEQFRLFHEWFSLAMYMCNGSALFRYQAMLAEVKGEWEKAYQKRLEDLQKREKEATDCLDRKRQEVTRNSLAFPVVTSLKIQTRVRREQLPA